MSDTPRTDAASRMAFSGEYMVEIEEAQKMERELADMTKQINPYEREAAKAAINALKRELVEVTKQRDHYKKACDQYSEDEMLCKLAEVTKQRDALAEAMNEMWLFIEEDDHPNCNTPAFNAAIAKYKAALAAVKGDSDE